MEERKLTEAEIAVALENIKNILETKVLPVDGWFVVLDWHVCITDS